MIHRLLKVATPPAALTGFVPLSVPPPPGLVPKAMLMEAELPVTVLPKASWIVTVGLMLTPATVLLGCVVNTSLFAVPGVIVNGLLVAPVRPLLAAVSM